MRLASVALALVAAIVATPSGVLGQDQNVPGTLPPIEGLIQGSAASVDSAGAPGSAIIAQVWCGLVEDETTRTECWESYRASLRYYESGLEHRSRVFQWQHFSTRVIFFVVLVIVATGIFFAWVQFRKGLKPVAPQRVAGEEKGGSPAREPEHEIEISMQGIRVSSPALGVVILALSLGFFYLYLAYVYPISEVF
ncbi:MAG TPA: hypothetical protein VLA09_10300 [Longimicrobiales bacterium]|nr:hypothetical protein [Longimicrobiales bacterium]